MTTTLATPQVWIGCLASYNAGRLIGEWVDATDVDDMNECQQRVAARAVEAAKAAGEWPVYFGDPEEFLIADYDGFPGSAVSALGEYPSYEDVARIGAAIEEHGEPYRAWLETLDDLDDADGDRFVDCYRGEWASEAAYAEDYVFEVGWANVPARVDVPSGPFGERRTIAVFDELAPYIDWEAVARELFDHGDLSSYDTAGGRVHVFAGVA